MSQWTLWSVLEWPTHRTFEASREGETKRRKVRVIRGPFFEWRAWRKLNRKMRGARVKVVA